LRDGVRLSVFERNVLQGGYRDVNRGSANRTGWNSIMGSFVIRKATNCVRIVGRNLINMTMQLTGMEKEGIEIFAVDMQKKTSFGR
jgi:hypothetical protein